MDANANDAKGTDAKGMATKGKEDECYREAERILVRLLKVWVDEGSNGRKVFSWNATG